MKKIILMLLLGFSAWSQTKVDIIPKPQSIIYANGNFKINKNTKIIPPSKTSNDAHILSNKLAKDLEKLLGGKISLGSNTANNCIEFLLKNSLQKDAYDLKVNSNKISIEASTELGFFYAYQTLLQMLPAEVYGSKNLSLASIIIPNCIIKDFPQYPYRGLMLDVSRHFFDVDYLKHLIDIMAMHKMNNLHLHLTDDQGWRIEIKKYPLLTSIGSKRKETMMGHFSDQKYDNTPYEGFYTQDQMKDLVKYAETKFINIVPEIEMPGHALAAIASYPEMGCTNTKTEVGTKWGIEENVYCPTEKTFEILEGVLSEIIDIFPSEYIHIGGDECPKRAWKSSTFCQDLMKKEGLKDENELQSYFISRIDKFVSAKGRKIVGWDEILEGGLSANATVMSWRGEDGGIEAAKKNHDVIMTPNTFVYLDYYQADPKTEPLAIGGYLPLEKTYSYNPSNSKLSKDQLKYIKGVQANLWTEYIDSDKKADYMFFPRGIAVAEIGWSEGTKDFNDFVKRLNTDFSRLDALNVNYCTAINALKFETTIDKNGFPIVQLISKNGSNKIKYTTDGSEPTAKSQIYNSSKPILGTSDLTVYALMQNAKNVNQGNAISKTYTFSKATGKKYQLLNAPKKFLGEQDYALTDGIRGDEMSYNSWVGFEGQNFDCTLDLLQKYNFDHVSIGFLNDSKASILAPKDIRILISDDNKNFKEVKFMQLSKSPIAKFVQQLNISIESQSARYVKIIASYAGDTAGTVENIGQKSWIFVDDISVK